VVTYQSTVTSYQFLYAVAVTTTASSPYVYAGTAVQFDSYNSGIGNLQATPVFIGNGVAGYTLVMLYYTSGGLFARGGTEIAGNITLTSAIPVSSSFSLGRPAAAINNVAGANASFLCVNNDTNYVTVITIFAAASQLPVLNAINTIITTGSSGSMCGFAYDTTQGKAVAAYKNDAVTRGSAAVITNAGYSTTAQNFIGFSTGSASSGASVGVSTYASVNSNVSGLTLGSRYNVTYTGSLTTSATGFPSAGKAYGTTKILVGV
jgi:hypothetical protein